MQKTAAAKMAPICVIFLLFLQIAFCLKDPYATLNVPRTASIPEIKQAYKRLAREWHPDKNKGSEAEANLLISTKLMNS